MPNDLIDKKVECPHCGHHIHLTLDSSAGDQNYYDECPACCHDIHINLHVNDYFQKVEVAIDSDDEQVF